MIPPNVIPKIPEAANNNKFPLLISELFFQSLDARSKNMNKNGKRTVFAKMTPIFFIPMVIKIRPVDQKIAAANAASKPTGLSTLRPIFTLTTMLIIPKNIIAVPIRYLGSKGSPKNNVAKTIVKKGKVYATT